MRAVRKDRITVTVDRALLRAANAAVAAGRADSVSAWVNGALTAQADRERRLALLTELVADYEAEHGVITEEELLAQRRSDRRDSVVVRGTKRRSRRTKAA